MTNQVYRITNDKFSTLVVDNEAIKLSSKKYTSYEEFQNDWNKKLSLAKKFSVKNEDIVAISKEENSGEIGVKYKSLLGLFTFSKYYEMAIDFKDEEDADTVLNHFVQHRFFYKNNNKQTPFQAVSKNLFYLLFTIGFTLLGYSEAVGMANGTVTDKGTGKAYLFRQLIELLTPNGVLAAGALISLIIITKIWKRYKNPPNKITIVAPNSL